MKGIIKIRNRWDEIFSGKAVRVFVKVFGAVCAYFATFTFTTLFPFIGLLNNQGLVLIALVLALAFFFNEYLGMILFSFVILMAMSGGQSIVAIAVAVLCLFACGNSRFICALTMLVPLCIMNISDAEQPLLSLNLGYLIFFVCVYFNARIANKTWKYIFPVYYTLIAYNFGMYGIVVKDFFSTTWPEEAYTDVEYEGVSLFTEYANFEGDLAQLDITSLLILVLINLVSCYIIYQIIGLKNIKFLNMQLEHRDLIAILIAILVFVLSMVGVSKFQNSNLHIPFVSIIIQGIIAYIITRPFASYRICNELGKKIGLYDEERIDKALKSHDFSKSAREEIKDILDMYLHQSKYDAILIADKIPVNAVLIYGKEELDKRLVVEDALKETGIETIYEKGEDLFKEYVEKGRIEVLEKSGSKKKLQIVVIDKIENLIEIYPSDEKFAENLEQYVIENISKNATNKNALFIITTEMPEKLPETLYEQKCVNKVIYGHQKDSVLLNNTYRLMRAIGKGGMGLVYKAYHERLEVTVVVKKIINATQEKNAYKAEAEVLRQIKHSYLPKVYDVFEEDENFYTVMDYIPGKSLQQELVAKHLFREKDIVRWTKQLAEAVHYLHIQTPPIIHSDIKPGNIMLTPDGDICLIDFNISSIFNKSNLKAIGTTPGYSPIEQYGSIDNYKVVLIQKGVTLALEDNEDKESIGMRNRVIGNRLNKDDETSLLINSDETELPLRNNNESAQISNDKIAAFAKGGIDERTDIYSIGATIYHLMTGLRPSFSFIDIKPLESYNLPYSNQFIDIVEKCMRLDPQERYKSMAELRMDLDKIDFKDN